MTSDDIRNVPLVCALEDIRQHLAMIRYSQEGLYAHSTLIQGQDGMAEAVLSQFNRWEKSLVEVSKLIASSDLYRQQVDIHQISKIARFNAQAERDREEKLRLEAKTQLEREEQLRLDKATRLQQSKNEARDLEVRNAEAVASAARSAVQAIDDTKDKEINRLNNQIAVLRQEKDREIKELAGKLSFAEYDNRGFLAETNALRNKINILEKKIRDLEKALDQEYARYKEERARREALEARQQEGEPGEQEPGATEQVEGEQREGYCTYHRCSSNQCAGSHCFQHNNRPTDQCPDLTCREGA